MQQLAENIGAYYDTLYARGFDGPSAAVSSCKIPERTDEKFLKLCYSIFKKERKLFTSGKDFSIDSRELVSKINIRRDFSQIGTRLGE